MVKKPLGLIIMYWYLIQTKPNAHFIAKKNLATQNFEVFLPLIKTTSKSAGKFSTKVMPLFPNYLFLGTRSENPPWKSINSTKGVSRVVVLSDVYRPIGNIVIEDLKYRCNPEGILTSGPTIKTGDQVRIKNGPFSEFICEVENIESDQRVLVLMDIMQQKTKTTLSMRDLSTII